MLKNLAPIALLAVAYCFPVAAQVPDADVKSYLRTFSERPRPNSQPKISYRSLVATQNQKTGWFVGKWVAPGGFVAIYPSKVPQRVCAVTHTAQSSAYAEGMLQGAFLRTETPLFLSADQKYLKYAAGDVFVPVVYRGNAYLGWGLYDRTAQRSRFLTLAFEDRPPDPTSFLTTGATANAIKAQLQAAGCWRSPQIKSPGQVQQTIRGITATVSALPQAPTSRAFRIQFSNGTQEAFGVMPNRVFVYDANNRRIPSNFSSLLHGIVTQPGGIMEGTVTVFRPNVQRISVTEATPGGRRFDLLIAR